MSLSFIYQRHSVRKFKDEPVKDNDLMEILKAATYAPSGKNKQNWHFVIIKDKEKIKKIAQIVHEKTNYLASKVDDENLKQNFLKFLYYHTFFKDAPVLILAFAGPYPIGSDQILKIAGEDEALKRVISASPGIQNIAAAIENLMLAAAQLGYGTCWMTGPNYAVIEIEKFLEKEFLKEGYELVAMTPLGVPQESELKSPQRKPLSEVITIIE
ncbi:Nitroreductase [Alkalithermobacter thermoalcaliphilus JW-YL-7 = DSM 7308]|uniref:Nitroreductase n=1 Tax=Alkalithermobacter thermoalcaliphilus JW-YL-7 = DSM 7308 TaxID=1121328 RepID=A0A150FNT1_CLOPD|nr:nitroreductase [[Clostridium] paradoxum JW-YL-7 = DSM 7308]SHK86245.1 Nitroreductase [[Clostridium] paradoxum JW-YL-7 = DSM 7308]